MRLGGVETSLIGLLHALDYDQFEVDLFLYLHDGPLMSFIPQEVNLLPQNPHYASLLLPFGRNTWQMKGLKMGAKIYAAVYQLWHRIRGENFIYLLHLHRITHRFLPLISSSTYDLGLSFLTPHFTLAQKVKAPKKVAWIHTDYSQYALDEKSELRMWQSYDTIASISKASAEAFLQKFPSLQKKVQVIENILPRDFVVQRSDDFEVNWNSQYINLCSVGRFTYPKNFDSIPKIARIIMDAGLSIRWYLIGYGGDENLIRSQIAKNKVEDVVIMLGKQSNPYPYIKACDVYVQPSRYEGKAVTVREAQMLGKPVVITNYPSASSQLKHGVDGVILPMETEVFARELIQFLRNDKLQKWLSANCLQQDYTNHQEIQKITSLI